MDDREEERRALEELLRPLVAAGRKKKEIAETFGIDGGASMLSQHLSGNRPISFEAGLRYARGFGVPLIRLSRRLASLAQEAQAGAPFDAPSMPATKSAPGPADALPAALEVLGMALAKDMPDDVRQDLADALAKLAHRKGLQRHQEDVIRLLSAPPGKAQRPTA